MNYYKVINTEQSKIVAVIEAKNIDQAYELLRQEPLFPIKENYLVEEIYENQFNNLLLYAVDKDSNTKAITKLNFLRENFTELNLPESPLSKVFPELQKEYVDLKNLYSLIDIEGNVHEINYYEITEISFLNGLVMIETAEKDTVQTDEFLISGENAIKFLSKIKLVVEMNND
jgi:hypothetical protein